MLNILLVETQPRKWGIVFEKGPSEICAGQPLKNLKCYGLLLRAVFHKFYLVHSLILRLIYPSTLTYYHLSGYGFIERSRRPSMRKKCPYLEFFWSVFYHIQTRKIPNTDTFYAVHFTCPRFLKDTWNSGSYSRFRARSWGSRGC